MALINAARKSVRPLAGAGIEIDPGQSQMYCSMFAPSRGRELKYSRFPRRACRDAFAPSRGRELKSPTCIACIRYTMVRPLAGAGIEMKIP